MIWYTYISYVFVHVVSISVLLICLYIFQIYHFIFSYNPDIELSDPNLIKASGLSSADFWSNQAAQWSFLNGKRLETQH